MKRLEWATPSVNTKARSSSGASVRQTPDEKRVVNKVDEDFDGNWLLVEASKISFYIQVQQYEVTMVTDHGAKQYVQIVHVASSSPKVTIISQFQLP